MCRQSTTEGVCVVGPRTVQQQAVVKRTRTCRQGNGLFSPSIHGRIGNSHVLTIAHHPRLAVVESATLVATRDHPHAAIVESDFVDGDPGRHHRHRLDGEIRRVLVIGLFDAPRWLHEELIAKQFYIGAQQIDGGTE